MSNKDIVSQAQEDDKRAQKNMPAETGEEREKQHTEKSGKIRPFKKADRHIEILRAWEAERIHLAVISDKVTEAIERISSVDPEKEDWTDTEWAVYLARMITNRADCVSEEDLYLLHDIMIRSQEENI